MCRKMCICRQGLLSLWYLLVGDVVRGQTSAACLGNGKCLWLLVPAQLWWQNLRQDLQLGVCACSGANRPPQQLVEFRVCSSEECAECLESLFVGQAQGQVLAHFFPSYRVVYIINLTPTLWL